MTTHDPINAYLSNEMTPDQERQFLISVAASDSLRRALKSEVMIERIITRDERETAVPHALRSAILAEAGALAVASPAPKAEEPATTAVKRAPAQRRRWLGGGTIGAAGVAVGLLLSPVITSQQAPAVATNPVVVPTMTMAVATVPVPVPTPAVESSDRQEQVRTIVIDRFIPGRPASSFQRSVNTAPASTEQFRVRDYRRDNPLDPRTEKQPEHGIQAGSSSQSSPLAPAR